MLLACIELVGRTGAKDVQIRYCEEEKPIIWMGVAKYLGRKDRDSPSRPVYVVGAHTNPITALVKLLEQIVDGGECTHCHRPTGFTEDFSGDMPLNGMLCWYRYDPELKTFRRGCE